MSDVTFLPPAEPRDATIIITAIDVDHGRPGFAVVNTSEGEQPVYIPIKVANAIRERVSVDDYVAAGLVPNRPPHADKTPWMTAWVDLDADE